MCVLPFRLQSMHSHRSKASAVCVRVCVLTRLLLIARTEYLLRITKQRVVALSFLISFRHVNELHRYLLELCAVCLDHFPSQWEKHFHGLSEWTWACVFTAQGQTRGGMESSLCLLTVCCCQLCYHGTSHSVCHHFSTIAPLFTHLWPWRRESVKWRFDVFFFLLLICSVLEFLRYNWCFFSLYLVFASKFFFVTKFTNATNAKEKKVVIEFKNEKNS